MEGTSPERLVDECARLLQELGLSEYQARTFLALVRLGSGTARDVAEVGEVPRTRVYDAVDALHDRGLVDVQYVSPRKFTPVSREAAVHKLELAHRSTIAELSDRLVALDPAPRPTEEGGVWVVSDTEAVVSRLFEFVDEAEETVVYATVDDRLTDDHVDRLRAATERGVDVHLGGVSEAVQARVERAIPAARFFETRWAWSETDAERLLVADDRTALVSLRGGESTPQAERAIWGTGEHNGLVVLLRDLFTWRRSGENAHRESS